MGRIDQLNGSTRQEDGAISRVETDLALYIDVSLAHKVCPAQEYKLLDAFN
jgi:hypothetical protein